MKIEKTLSVKAKICNSLQLYVLVVGRYMCTCMYNLQRTEVLLFLPSHKLFFAFPKPMARVFSYLLFFSNPEVLLKGFQGIAAAYRILLHVTNMVIRGLEGRVMEGMVMEGCDRGVKEEG